MKGILWVYYIHVWWLALHVALMSCMLGWCGLALLLCVGCVTVLLWVGVGWSMEHPWESHASRVLKRFRHRDDLEISLAPWSRPLFLYLVAGGLGSLPSRVFGGFPWRAARR